MRLPPKNMNQGIYWVSTYLKYNLDKPSKSVKQPKLTKQQEYRTVLLEMLQCFEYDEYPEDIVKYINEIERVLQLKTINSKHFEKIQNMCYTLLDKYK
jgi:hypothetical protein